MKTLIPAAIRCSLMFTAVAALSLVYPASVQAVPTTYQYTGNPLTVATYPYATSDFVTVMVTLAGPLAPNMPLTAVTPLAFTLSDGVQTMTNHTVNSAFFVLATGPTGQISGWAVDVDGPFEFDGVDYNARILTDNTMQFVTDSGSVLMPVAVGEQVSAEIAILCERGNRTFPGKSFGRRN
jgi:hypothetical protein